MRLRTPRKLLALAVLLAPIPLPAVAADTDVDLELVLAVDVSRSMDANELALQRAGYVKAFRHAEVIKAIRTGARGRIAVTYLEWSESDAHRVVVPWTAISDAAEASGFADALEHAPIIPQAAGTSISSGLFFAAGQLNASPFRGDRQTVDVSGDGPNNIGMPVVQARDWLVSRGVTINGLPILVDTVYAYGQYVMPDLDTYYRDCVIGGPGAFFVRVGSMAQFEVAVRRKLVLEVAGLPPKVMLAAAETSLGQKADCLAGEHARRQFILLK